jgi:hypothetical protein
MMRARALVLMGCALGVAGCAPGALRFDAGGSDGTGSRVQAIRAAFLRGDGAAALARVAEKDAGSGDHLLRLLERGQVALDAGDAARAALAFDEAYWMTAGRAATMSASNGAAALLTSDRALPYLPGTTERAMMHYYGARAWVALGNVQEATVEARRLSALLALVDGSDAALPDALTATLHEVAAAIFAAAGDHSDAEVSWRLAARARGDSAASAGPPALCAGCGSVVVLAERGLVSQRGARGLGVAIADGDLRGLASVRDDASGLASVLAAVDRSTRPQACGWNARATCGWDRRELDGAFTIINVSWPELRAPHRPSWPMSLSVGEHHAVLPRGASVSDGVAVDFAQGARGRLARLVARTAVRQVLAEAGTDAIRSSKRRGKNKDAARVAGAVAIIAAGASSLAERADTRSWALLPDELVVHRVTVPAGEYVLRRGDAAGGLMGTVRVAAGATVIVSAREWALAAPAPVLAGAAIWP